MACAYVVSLQSNINVTDNNFLEVHSLFDLDPMSHTCSACISLTNIPTMCLVWSKEKYWNLCWIESSRWKILNFEFLFFLQSDRKKIISLFIFSNFFFSQLNRQTFYLWSKTGWRTKVELTKKLGPKYN